VLGAGRCAARSRARSSSSETSKASTTGSFSSLPLCFCALPAAGTEG